MSLLSHWGAPEGCKLSFSLSNLRSASVYTVDHEGLSRALWDALQNKTTGCVPSLRVINVERAGGRCIPPRFCSTRWNMTRSTTQALRTFHAVLPLCSPSRTLLVAFLAHWRGGRVSRLSVPSAGFGALKRTHGSTSDAVRPGPDS